MKLENHPAYVELESIGRRLLELKQNPLFNVSKCQDRLRDILAGVDHLRTETQNWVWYAGKTAKQFQALGIDIDIDDQRPAAVFVSGGCKMTSLADKIKGQIISIAEIRAGD